MDATGISKRLAQETANVPGVTLYLQPVQDLTLDAALSRTQYSSSCWKRSNLSAFDAWVPKLIDRLQQRAGGDRCRERSGDSRG